MHYLRNTPTTLDHLQQAGYLYDATVQGLKDPWLHPNGLWIFPLQIMDGWVINGDKRYQSRTFEEARDYTLQQIAQAKTAGLEYLSILFHDRYMSPAFRTWKQWYEWLVPHLRKEGCEFLTHRQAVADLSTKHMAK